MADGRQDQRFPTLKDEEIARAARFGELKEFAEAEALFRTGETGIGLFVLISGRVAITRHDGGGHVSAVVDHGPGSIIGETAGT